MHLKGNYNFQPKGLKSNEGWYSRGYLPHFDGGEIAQFITFRLFDSMPQHLLEKWRLEITDEASQIEFRKKIERFLDAGYGSCFLARHDIAELVQKTLIFHQGKKYRLVAWVIMPNHVHILLIPLPEIELSKIMHSIKSYTSHEANKLLGRKGQFWQPESFDRYIRNSEHFSSVRRYIENNPVKARLCERAEDWLYSSANGGNRSRCPEARIEKER